VLPLSFRKRATWEQKQSRAVLRGGFFSGATAGNRRNFTVVNRAAPILNELRTIFAGLAIENPTPLLTRDAIERAVGILRREWGVDESLLHTLTETADQLRATDGDSSLGTYAISEIGKWLDANPIWPKA
jgi:hypothetical protein